MTESKIPDSASVASPLQRELNVSTLHHREVIGRTQTTDVHRVEPGQADLPETIAIKHPSRNGTLSEDTIERFQTEAERWAQLDDHPHITGVIDWGIDPLPWLHDDGAVPWIAMEDMDGGNLSDYAGEVSVAQALWTAERIADAVWAAHHDGVIHLDIKPANILFRETGKGTWNVPKVADWELARTVLDHSDSVGITTVKYTTPEQARNDATDQRTDQFQLGIVLYELLTGQHPFVEDPDNAPPGAIVASVKDTDLTPPSCVRSAIPSALDDVLLRALSKDPEDRYEATLQFRDEIRSVRDEMEPTELVFRTRSPDGNPVIGATVSFTVDGRERRLTTGDDGIARDQLPGGVTEIHVTFGHDRYEPVSGTLDVRMAKRQGKQPGLDLEMEPLTGELETVVTFDGESVPDVAVVAEPGPDVGGGTERATTDRAGRAAFDALPIGEYTIGVDLSDAGEEYAAPDSTVTVTEGETRRRRLPIQFDYRLGGGSTRRIEEVRSRLDATTSHPRSDMSIPAFYASVVEELLRTVERVPEEGTTFLAAGRSPEETVDALLTAAEAGVDAIEEAMSDEENVDLFAACADMEPADATWDGSFSLADLFELAELQPGKRRGRVAERLDTVNDRISDERRGLSEVGPARSVWVQTRDLASDRSREGLEAAAATMLAEGLLEAIEALFEWEALRERMKRTEEQRFEQF